LTSVTIYMANGHGYETYCHSIKTHDSDSPASCLDCKWEGFNEDLLEVDEPVKKKPKRPKKDMSLIQVLKLVMPPNGR
jgi:hypothetical protein